MAFDLVCCWPTTALACGPTVTGVVGAIINPTPTLREVQTVSLIGVWSVFSLPFDISGLVNVYLPGIWLGWLKVMLCPLTIVERGVVCV